MTGLVGCHIVICNYLLKGFLYDLKVLYYALFEFNELYVLDMFYKIVVKWKFGGGFNKSIIKRTYT